MEQALLRKFGNHLSCIHPYIGMYIHMPLHVINVKCNNFVPKAFSLEIGRGRLIAYIFDIGHPCYMNKVSTDKYHMTIWWAHV